MDSQGTVDCVISEQSYVKNAIAFHVDDNVSVTVLSSKNAGKFRIQGPTLAHSAPFCLDLKNRVEQICSKHNKPLVWTLEGHLPLQDYFTIVDEHIKVRIDMHD